MSELLSLTFAMIVGAIISVAITVLVLNKDSDSIDQRYSATAASMTGAVRNFAQQNRTTIINAAQAAGGTVTYSVANLITANVLDPSVLSTTLTGGTWCIEFGTYGSPTQLHGLLTVVNETATRGRGDAGVITTSTGMSYTGMISGTSAIGPDFNIPLSTWSGPGACAPVTHAFAALISDNDSVGAGTSNWLARVPIPNNPLANTMSTDISMDSNSINTANAITASTVSTNSTTPAAGDINANDFNATGNVTATNVTASTNIQAATIVAATSLTAQDFYTPSDARLKTPLEPVDPWALLAPVRGGRINWLADGRPDLVVIAQDVEQTMPELVATRPDGMKTVRYEGLIPVLVSAVQDLRGDLGKAWAENDRLRVANDNLQRRLHRHAGR